MAFGIQPRRILLVGAPLFFQYTSVRVVAALAISAFFLTVQIEYQPYQKAEHGVLSKLTDAQITLTLLLVAMQSAGMTISPVAGFVCVVLNLVSIPLVAIFNARRLDYRKRVFAMLLSTDQKSEMMIRRPAASKHGDVAWSSGRLGDAGPSEDDGKFIDLSSFRDIWQAGRKSKKDIFSAVLEWMDHTLQDPPISEARWTKLLLLLKELPLNDTRHGDIRFGASNLSTYY